MKRRYRQADVKWTRVYLSMLMPDRPALLLDLDGTLVDSVYQHAIAWHKALELAGIKLSVWRIHRRIGMSGGLLADSLARETGHELTEEDAAKLKKEHARLFAAVRSDVLPLPGALDLVRHLTKMRVAWAVASVVPHELQNRAPSGFS